MCIKDYETEIGGQGPVRAVEILGKNGLDEQGVGVRVPVAAKKFSSPCRPDRFWGPSSLLSNCTGGLFPRR
jgi:hypothetical protein